MAEKDKHATEYLNKDVKPQSFVVHGGKLVVVSGPDQGKEVVVNKPEITLGTTKTNDMVLSDTTVSRKHAVLKEVSGRFMLNDMNSTNGTFLNNLRIREAFLDFGALIGLGNTRISFVPFEDRVEVFPSEQNHFGTIYGQSVKMRTIFAMLERVVKTDATIIIEGETGTGKELLAKAIHETSSRADKPFVVFDCSAVAQNLIESELFGHEKGAFTGAAAARQGVFEQADTGTVFLDEIGELGIDLQPRLLRVLENREVKRVGGNKTSKVNVRVIAATNRDLAEEVKKGSFREDLFYRLSVLRLNIPSLRERKEDIPLITRHLVANLAAEYGIETPPEVKPETFDILKSHDWPGNVRELRNVLSRALAMGNRSEIEPRDLLLSSAKQAGSDSFDSLAGMSLDEIEKTAIVQTLEKHGGNKTKTAKALGIAYSTLYEKMKKHQIK